MGPSGSGKTSLLKVLNGQMKTKLSEESKFYLSKYCPIRVCYLTQEISGHLMPGLTALQSLIYASKLKNASEVSNVDHESIARNILNELNIADTADTYVQKCSGGERKRLALGLELTSLRMPNLICIDEPTSGLDSNSAEVVIECLHRVAHSHNLTIITSVHQPNIQILMMFDQLYVLAKGGVCVYSGRPMDIRQFLTRIPGQTINENIFPVEQLIRYSCLNHTDKVVQTLVRFKEAEITKQTEMELERDTQQVIDGIPTIRNRFSLWSCWMLLLRYFAFIRGHQWIPYIVFTAIIIFQGPSLVNMIDKKIIYTSGCINWEESYNNTCNQTQQEKDADEDLKWHLRFILAANCFLLSLIFLQCSITFANDLRYFWNEHRNGWYSSGAFYSSRMVIEWIPLFIAIIGFSYTINIYESIRPGLFYWFIIIFTIAAIPMQCMGYLLAILTSKNFNMMIIIITVLTLIHYMLSGSNTPIDDLHYTYQFISNFIPTRFVNSITLLLQFGFDRCRYKEIQSILYYFSITDDHFNHSIIMLIANGLFYQLLALIALIIKANPFKSRRQRAKKILDHHQTMKRSNVIIPGIGCHHEFTIKQFRI
ncbi:hypothetical protein BLA29_003491 [Euroglyphus maynei]|uniref:ABC transporter domain-containing protein n=1 Tax=Euroglyphus maynei TaxID=6958 RepID=A0A1Y3ATR4_EURMA|nr:hypothetical protein BLA29_003491 [Euroglyphus maynei]